MDKSSENDHSYRPVSEKSYQQTLLKLIFEITPIGMAVVKSPDLVYQMANPAYRKCLPVADLDPIDHRYEEVWPPDNGFESLALIQKVIETGDAFDADDYELVYPDGHARNFDLRLRRLSWGEALTVLIVTWDITDLGRTGERSDQLPSSREVELEAEVEEHVEDMLELERYLFAGLDSDRKESSEKLHNGPVQELYAILFQLHFLQAELEQEAVVEAFNPILSRINKVNQDLRDIYYDLWPTTLNFFGLASAISGHVKNLQESHPEIEFHVDLATNGRSLSEDICFAIFRIYQKGIANSLEHADASRVDINLSVKEEIVLEIQDDGRGFEIPNSWLEFARNGQYGLLEAAERARCLGGRMEIASEEGKGTNLRAMFPRSPKE
ncbi:MAG TPA: PAS domain-containing protein [Anaerolineales bacterium]